MTAVIAPALRRRIAPAARPSTAARASAAALPITARSTGPSASDACGRSGSAVSTVPTWCSWTCGCRLKAVTADRLFDAVRVVAAGEALLAPAVTRRLITEFARLRPRSSPGPAALAALTPRETEMLRLVAEGLSNLEIATRLVVSEETVKTHVRRVLAKLGLRDRTQAVVMAYESGLVVPGGLV
jgi:DNA-binding CsgD family transcriptional regulator